MVTEFGMSDKLGPLSFGKRDELVFLGREIGEQRNYSRRGRQDRSTRRSGRSSTGPTSGRPRSSRPTATGSIALAEKLVAEETVDSEEFEKLFSDLPPKQDLHGDAGDRRPRPAGPRTEPAAGLTGVPSQHHRHERAASGPLVRFRQPA